MFKPYRYDEADVITGRQLDLTYAPTQAHKSVAVAKANGWHGMVAGTRKTTPGVVP